MKTLNQFAPLAIHDHEIDEYDYQPHYHTYYELVYIHKGKGHHIFNESRIPYEAGDLFLLAPGDLHYFEIARRTHFTFIKFTESYFESRKHFSRDEFNIGAPEMIMRLKYLKEGKLHIGDPCKDILRSTVINIVAYSRQHSLENSPIVYYQMLTIFGIMKEYLQSHCLLAGVIRNFDHQQLISYIHENVYDRDKTAIKNVAAYFNISETYFSNFFKRHFNISYRNYLDNYRTELIEKRLLTSGLQMKHIAAEFGFSDVSHFSKTFKRIKGISPGNFGKKISAA
ncbi:AraC family transcriptional regulator [Mucilaginibacter conchicola]|uniref:AraC family transcriptional regulator n=1 Tax=Mucilaginibacter conchicola TaxID=2303333 RepID=A0A372NPU5_9SPHI|nr:AraC family transcriptional regulator [Mucilaginibacter conchicola]RFZ90954.1 AraC family transcriptional regulator [Mucilaginibacter conchicola]